MINDPEGLEIWYQANLACARNCKAWQLLIDQLKARRHTEQRPDLEKQTKAQLADFFKDQGEIARRAARKASKNELVEAILQHRERAIDTEIARLEKLIADNQPAQQWRER